MPYVFSTASADGYYTQFSTAKKDGSPGTILKQVLIKGGATIAPMQKGLLTPRGIVTAVSEEDLDFLMKNPAFKRHMDAGFVKVTKTKNDPEKVASDMTESDQSSPKVVDKTMERTATVTKPTLAPATEVVKKAASKSKG